MSKKIFAVIGIVLGSALAFVGAVVGVLAIQGKFKKPVVYPTRLSFAETEKTIVASANQNQLYSFALNGYNDGAEHDVTKKVCHISFHNNVGEDLITLCDANGNALLKVDKQNRYITHCNENTYFKLKTPTAQSFAGAEFGKVVLSARDERGQVIANNHLTIWIDRELTQIKLDDDLAETETINGIFTQTFNLGLQVKQEFNFSVAPEFSLHPISKEEAKIVEVYYKDVDGYKILNPQNISSYPFLGYDSDNQKMFFQSAQAGQFEFRIAVFPTYQARVDYYQNEANSSDDTTERINKMVNTAVVFNVVNSDVDSIGMDSVNGVSLNLYENNNYITLNGVSGVENANDNNLQLYMMNGGRRTTARFNEVGFNLTEDKWSTNNILFESADKLHSLAYSYNKDTSTHDFKLTGFEGINYTRVVMNFDTRTISLQDDSFNDILTFTISQNVGNNAFNINSNCYYIEKLTCTYNEESITLTSSSGAVFIERDNLSSVHLKKLTSGSYLNFYVLDQDSASLVTSSNFQFSASVLAGSTGNTRSFNVIAKNMVNLPNNQMLVLGLLVVNSNGKTFFASQDVTINEVNLSFNLINANPSLNVNYNYNKDNKVYNTTYGEMAFEDIVEILRGSYNACVLVTEQHDAGVPYTVEVIEGITYTKNDKSYVLVGYMQDGVFVNKVKVNSNATSPNTKLYIVQLKNAYNQTSEEIINSILATSGTVLAPVNNDYIRLSSEINLTVNYPFVTDDLTFDFNAANKEGTDEFVTVGEINNQIKNINIVENTGNHILKLYSPINEMFANMINSGLSTSNIKVYLYNASNELQTSSASNIQINGLEAVNDGELLINYTVMGSLTDSTNYLKLVVSFAGSEIQSLPIYILSTLPQDIKFNYTENEKIKSVDLYESELDAKRDGSYYFEIKIGLDNNYYTYNYSLKHNSETILDLTAEQIFNSSSNKIQNFGFYVVANYGIEPQNLTFASVDDSIVSFDNGKIQVNSLGEAVIYVQSGSGLITRYVKIKVVQDGNFVFSKTGDNSVEATQFNLGEILEFSYNGASKINTDLVWIENLEVTLFGGGEELEVVETETGFNIRLANESAIVVLSVSKINGVWTFTRQNYISTGLTISFDAVAVVGKISFTIEFVSSIQINRNPAWAKIFAGTKVVLYEIVGENQAFEQNSIFRVINKNSANTISVKCTSGNSSNISYWEDSTIEFGTPGVYTFVFSVDNATIATYTLNVVPNIYMSATKAELQSATDYNLSDIVAFNSFRGDFVFGQSASVVPYQEIDADDNLYLTVLNSGYSFEDITLSSNLQNSLINVGEKTDTNIKLSVGWLEDVNAIVNESLSIKYLDYELGGVDVEITNKYSVAIINKNLMAGVEYSAEDLATANGTTTTLNKVEYVSEADVIITFNKNASNNFVISFASKDSSGQIHPVKNARVKYTFAIGDNELTYVTIEDDGVFISPYLPEEKINPNKAYSEQSYDLLNNLFIIKADNDSILDSFKNNISSFVVTRVDNEAVFESMDFLGSGYTSTSNNAGCEARFAKINSNTLTVKIYYTVVYTDGTTYTFDKDLTIYNNQIVDVSMPFMGLAETNLNFIIKDIDDAKNLNAIEAGTQDYYTVPTLNYEVVNVNETIGFNYDDNFSITRVKIKNASNQTFIDDDFQISIAAYQSRGNVGENINNIIAIDNFKKSITINSHASFPTNSYFYAVLKITSTSGAVEYYGLYVYNQIGTTYSAASYNTNLQKSTKQLGELAFKNATNTTILGVDVKSNTNSNFENLTFTSADFNNVNLYLLSVSSLEENLNAELAETFAKYENVNGVALKEISNYATIKLGVIYISNTSKVYLGSITIYIQPETHEIVNDTKLSNVVTGIQSGEYNRVIETIEKEIQNPFTLNGAAVEPTLSFVENSVTAGFELNVDAKQIQISGQTTSVISIDGTTLKLDKYVTEQLSFTVKYSFATEGEEFVILVHYSYNPLNVSLEAKSFTVGNAFSRKNGFNNKLNFNQLVGNYNRIIKLFETENEANFIELDLSTDLSVDVNNLITISGCTLNVTIEGSQKYITFSQSESNQTVNFSIKYLDLGEGNSKTDFAVSVAPGIYIDQVSGSAGQNKNSPLSSISYNNFNQLAGSHTNVVYSNSNAGKETTEQTETPIWYSYTIGGLTIYTNNQSTLSCSFDEPNFVVNGENVLAPDGNLTIDGKLTTDGTSEIEFTHSALDGKIITMTIEIEGENGTYTNPLTNSAYKQLLYIDVAKTYNGLQANYLINADSFDEETMTVNYENVYSSQTGTSAFEFIFASPTTASEHKTDLNESKPVYNTRKVSLLDANGEAVDADFVAMGFGDENNPNKINFIAGAGISLVGGITFNPVNDNTLTSLTMSNSAGLSNFAYNIQIMADDSWANGLKQNDNLQTSSADKTSLYALININDSTSSEPFKFGATTNPTGGEETMLGNGVMDLMDGRNNNFFITSAKYKMNEGTSENSITTARKTYSSNYGITYELTIETGLTFTIRLGKDNKLYVGLKRDKDTEIFSVLQLQLAIASNGGEIADDFKVIFLNYNISSNYENTFKSTYGTSEYDITNDFKFIGNKTGSQELSLDNAKIISGSYSLGSSRDVQIDTGTKDISCPVFSYNLDTKVITTNAVPSQARVNITMAIETELFGRKYVVKYLNYNFNVNRNFEFKVNNEKLNGNQEFETRYILNSKGLNGGEYPYSINLTNLYNPREDLTFNTINYATTLNVKLIRVSNQIEIGNIYTIEQVSNFEGVDINNETHIITFNKDFTGNLILKLTVDTGVNGKYSVLWNINVLGFIDLQYANALGADAIQAGPTSEGFASNQTVNLFSTVGSQNSGVTMTSPLTNDEFAGKLGVSLNSEDVEKTVEYIVLPFTNSIDAKTLFTNNDAGKTIAENVNFDMTKLSVTLPVVPQSSLATRDYYLVIYRVTLTYLGQTTNEYYVTYKVYNNTTVINNNDTIDVDNNLQTVSGNQYLELFNFAETYTTVDNKEYTLTYDSNNYVLSDGTNSYTSIDGKTFTENGQTIVITKSADNYQIKIGDNDPINATRSIITNTNTDTAKSVFTSNFTTIQEFATFINSLDLNKGAKFTELDNLANGAKTAELAIVYIENGAYGVCLFDGTTAPLKFNNSLTGKLEIMAKSGKSAVTLDTFSLTTNNQITAKTTNVKLANIFLLNEMTTSMDKDALSAYNIIGLGTPDNTWVTKGTNKEDSNIVAPENVEFKVQGSDSTTTYVLKEVTYESTADSKLYNLTQKFYYIDTENTTKDLKITKMDYSKSLGLNFYQVNLISDITDEGENQKLVYRDSVLDLTNAIITWQMEGGVLKFTNTAVTTKPTANLPEDITEYGFDAGKLTISIYQLINYKAKHSDAETVRLSFSTGTLTFDAVFQLPPAGYQIPSTGETT